MDLLYRIFSRIGGRLFLGMLFVSIFGVSHHHSAPAKMNEENNNPWSKDYVAPAATASPTSESYGARAGGYDGSGESADDRIRDEQFRRQMVHEMREAYERSNGSGSDAFAAQRND